MAKRKRSAGAAVADFSYSEDPRNREAAIALSTNATREDPKPPRRRSSRRVNSTVTGPNGNPDILDGISAVRASPDRGENEDLDLGVKPCMDKVMRTRSNLDGNGVPKSADEDAYATTEVGAGKPELVRDGQGYEREVGGSARLRSNANVAAEPISETVPVDQPPRQPGKNKRTKHAVQHVNVDSAESNIANVRDVTQPPHGAIQVAPDVDERTKDENEDEEEVKEALSRPPPVNSDRLPLPWKGRLGYACLNTYLRNANPPVFCSRTCRIASILEHRHPLKDPSQPEHPTKNRPDKDKAADVTLGQKYVEELALANARDIIKMVRWNDKYGIKFMRLSSEMFPFASHDVYGYKLAPFAADTLAKAGKVIAELGHRVTAHPGQFTQLGSPRKEVIDNAFRDLDYHDEMLSLLKLPPQQDRDAVMILHLGGAYGDKDSALDRFRKNYARLSQSVKNRLVLENDDVVWSVHDLLPLCQELNIPLVLDFHHHNIVFDSTKLREGTKDIVELFPAILETWTRKNITPKMHYSEPCPDAVTARSRRKHSPRVMTLPPCPDTMDLMIEAKDKEQAVFELMRTFKLPGFDLFNDVIPHTRQDENKKSTPKKAPKKSKEKADGLDDIDARIEKTLEERSPPIVPDYELSMGGPERRVYWPPGMEDWLRPPKRIIKTKDDGTGATPAKKKRKTAAAAEAEPSVNGDIDNTEAKISAKKPAPKRAASAIKKKATRAPAPGSSDDGNSSSLSDLGEDLDVGVKDMRALKPSPLPTRKRSSRVQRVSYIEDAAEMSI